MSDLCKCGHPLKEHSSSIGCLRADGFYELNPYCKCHKFELVTNPYIFYIVMRDKENGTFVSKRHDTLEEARAEAERLCRKEGINFYVLKVVGMARRDDAPVIWEEV